MLFSGLYAGQSVSTFPLKIMRYPHLFFDLDHTLWDFDRNSDETLHELYAEHRLDYWTTLPAFLTAFHQTNRQLWDLYNHSRISRQELRESRFFRIFGLLGIDSALVPAGIGDAYIHRCSHKPHLLPHAQELLDRLATHHTLHIVTNGFDDVQYAKMRSAGILHYFATITTSETEGFKKPDPRIFAGALARAHVSPAQVLMIGDNLETDIRGGKQAGLDTAFYNPKQTAHDEQPDYEFDCLRQLGEWLHGQ